MKQRPVLVTIGVIIAFFAVAVIVVLSFFEYIRQTNQFENFLESKAEETAFNVSYPLWNVNEAEIERVLETEMRFNNLRFIEIKDEANQVLMVVEQLGDSLEPRQVEISPECVSCRVRNADIYRDDVKIGTVVVHGDPSSVLRNVLWYAAALIVVTTMAGILLFQIFNYILFLQVQENQTKIKNQELEQASQRLKSKNQELERLTKELEKSTQKLQQKNEDLEKLNKLTIGRELKMIELKQNLTQSEQVAALKKVQRGIHEQAQASQNSSQEED